MTTMSFLPFNLNWTFAYVGAEVVTGTCGAGPLFADEFPGSLVGGGQPLKGCGGCT